MCFGVIYFDMFIDEIMLLFESEYLYICLHGAIKNGKLMLDNIRIAYIE